MLYSPAVGYSSKKPFLRRALTFRSLVWMNEGGQSSTGQLLDFMLETHPAWPKLLEQAKAKGINHFVLLNDLLQEQMKETDAPFLTYLTRGLHIYPDLHGTFTLLGCR